MIAPDRVKAPASKVFLKVFGCKVNQYEAQVMKERLAKQGFQVVSDIEEADYLLVNSCTVTEGSDKELEYLVRKTKRRHPKIKILLAGCYATNHLEKIEKDPLIDGRIEDRNKEFIPELIRNYEASEFRHFSNEMSEDEANEYYGISSFDGRSRAFLKVQDGCNKECAFCIVTIVRGNSRSRPPEDIVQEAARLVVGGYQEIVLTGVQVGAYGRDFKNKGELPRLIEKLSSIKELQRIRLSSVDPLYVDDDLLRCMRENPKFCNHLHISLQSGDDGILKKMRRGHGRDYFLKLIDSFYSALDGFAYSTDMIAGFPGEDEAAFERSCEILQRTRPMKIHAFPYSDREGTTAYDFSDKVPAAIKKERVSRLIEISKESFKKNAERFLGKRKKVLVERVTPQERGGFLALGKLDNYIAVSASTPAPIAKGIRKMALCGIQEEFMQAALNK